MGEAMKGQRLFEQNGLPDAIYHWWEGLAARLFGQPFQVIDDSDDGAYILSGFDWNGRTYITRGLWVSKQ